MYNRELLYGYHSNEYIAWYPFVLAVIYFHTNIHIHTLYSQVDKYEVEARKFSSLQSALQTELARLQTQLDRSQSTIVEQNEEIDWLKK